jgi:hypothetical protein
MDIQFGDPESKTAAAKAERGKCAPCPLYTKCLFHLPRNGGFRGQGKRYIAYTLITDSVENSNGKQDFVDCATFVEGFQDRMLSGQAAAAEGRKGAEIIRLLVDKQPGDTLDYGEYMAFNGRGEIVRPQPNRIADLEASGHKVNRDDMSPPVAWNLVEYQRTLPDYNAPKKTASAYSEKIRNLESEQNASEAQDEAARYEERFAEMEATHGKKRGRPPGSRNKPKDDEETPDLA